MAALLFAFRREIFISYKRLAEVEGRGRELGDPEETRAGHDAGLVVQISGAGTPCCQAKKKSRHPDHRQPRNPAIEPEVSRQRQADRCAVVSRRSGRE